MYNRDDHSKNFAYLLTDKGWELSPAYDLIFSTGIAGEHSMTIAGEEKNLDKSHLLKVANQLNINTKEAHDIIDQVAAIRNQWLDFAEQAHVPKRSAQRMQKIFTALKIIS